MKKLVMTAAVIACAASVVTAQTVTSANIVGYSKDTANVGFHIAANQFQGGAKPSEVIGDQLAVGTKLYVFNGSSYLVSEYINTFDEFFNEIQAWDNDALDLSISVGFWVENKEASVQSSIISGEVPLDTSVTNNIQVGFQLISYPYPVSRVITQLGFSPTVGDKIYKFNGTSYVVSEYINTFDEFFNEIQAWDNETLTFGVGEGFWYEAVSAQSWIVNRPF